jgi:CobQ/CobB/MinD/ParA nucleotide binding domain
MSKQQNPKDQKSVNGAASNAPITQIVADLGAGTQRHVAEFERVLGIAQAAKDFGYNPILVFLLAPSKDSIGLLGEAVRSHKKDDGWKFVIAKATYETGDWSLWENSKTKKEVDTLAPEYIDIPILDAKAFTACDKLDLRFKDADRTRLSYVEAAYTKRWFDSLCQLFETSPALSANTPGKRLILVGSGKGGVGKSTTSRGLIDYYDNRGLGTLVFDGDLENPTLSRFIETAIPLASQMTEGFEALVRAMEDPQALSQASKAA